MQIVMAPIGRLMKKPKCISYGLDENKTKFPRYAGNMA